MPLVPCRYCERPVPDAATLCEHCGSPYPVQPTPAAWPEQPGGEIALAPVAVAAEDELHPMAVWKLVLLSVCTFGIYEVFWFYRNWKRVRERTGRQLSPFWRAFFTPIWSFSLFDEAAGQARVAELSVGWSPMLLGLAFFLLSAFWRLPDPWSLLSLFSFLPLLPVQQTINELAARRGVRPDDTFDGRHVAVVVVGSIMVVLAIIGSMLPPK